MSTFTIDENGRRLPFVPLHADPVELAEERRKYVIAYLDARDTALDALAHIKAIESEAPLPAAINTTRLTLPKTFAEIQVERSTNARYGRGHVAEEVLTEAEIERRARAISDARKAARARARAEAAAAAREEVE